jgi:hypothetical protein
MPHIGTTELMFLVPLVIIEVGLLGWGYADLARREQVRGGQKWVWALVMLISFIGPVLYFALGREE